MLKGNLTISSYEYSYYLDGSDACKKRNESGIIETTDYEYDGLKRLTEEEVKVGNNTTDTYAFRYRGEYYDKETSTVYLRARYYSPSSGRFISRDSFAGKKEDPLLKFWLIQQ